MGQWEWLHTRPNCLQERVVRNQCWRICSKPWQKSEEAPLEIRSLNGSWSSPVPPQAGWAHKSIWVDLGIDNAWGSIPFPKTVRVGSSPLEMSSSNTHNTLDFSGYFAHKRRLKHIFNIYRIKTITSFYQNCHRREKGSDLVSKCWKVFLGLLLRKDESCHRVIFQEASSFLSWNCTKRNF